MTKGQTTVSRARHARARALEAQDRFLNCWVECRSFKEALWLSGVTWHHIQAWRRWHPSFRKTMESVGSIVRFIRKEDLEERAIRRAFAGSHRARDMLFRLFWSDRVCPLCRRRWEPEQVHGPDMDAPSTKEPTR